MSEMVALCMRRFVSIRRGPLSVDKTVLPRPSWVGAFFLFGEGPSGQAASNEATGTVSLEGYEAQQRDPCKPWAGLETHGPVSEPALMARLMRDEFDLVMSWVSLNALPDRRYRV